MTVKCEIDTLLRAIDYEITDLQRGSRSGYTEEEARQDIARFQAQAREACHQVEQQITHAIRGVPNWGGSNVTLVSHVDEKPVIWPDDINRSPYVNTTVYAHVHQNGGWRGAPSFAVFSDEEGRLQGIDDVLDAGDRDFFNDPAVEADYFGLTEALRNPGRARAQANKVVKLFTARPQKDRRVYENATRIPNNVFLTTDPDEAWGYARDLGGDRDIYEVRIKRQFLVETLDAGSHKNYQTFSGGGLSVPVESIDLIQEGGGRMAKTKGARVLRRYLEGAAQKSAPEKIEPYFQKVKDQNPDYSDSQAWATAWSIYCKYKKPGDPSCHQDEYFRGRDKKAALLYETKRMSVLFVSTQEFSPAIPKAINRAKVTIQDDEPGHESDVPLRVLAVKQQPPADPGWLMSETRVDLEYPVGSGDSTAAIAGLVRQTLSSIGRRFWCTVEPSSSTYHPRARYSL